jgi:ubiquinol oxidase
VALNYYKAGDLYLFDQLQTGWPARAPRRPPCASLYDVFINIRDDEEEHVKTMSACKDGSIGVDLDKWQARAAGGEGGGGEAAAAAAAPAVRVVGTFDEEEGYVSGLDDLLAEEG